MDRPTQTILKMLLQSYSCVGPMKCSTGVELFRLALIGSYDLLTSSVIYYWTDGQQHGIYLIIKYTHAKHEPILIGPSSQARPESLLGNVWATLGRLKKLLAVLATFEHNISFRPHAKYEKINGLTAEKLKSITVCKFLNVYLSFEGWTHNLSLDNVRQDVKWKVCFVPLDVLRAPLYLRATL